MGVLLLELITGLPAADGARAPGHRLLAQALAPRLGDVAALQVGGFGTRYRFMFRGLGAACWRGRWRWARGWATWPLCRWAASEYYIACALQSTLAWSGTLCMGNAVHASFCTSQLCRTLAATGHLVA